MALYTTNWRSRRRDPTWFVTLTLAVTQPPQGVAFRERTISLLLEQLMLRFYLVKDWEALIVHSFVEDLTVRPQQNQAIPAQECFPSPSLVQQQLDLTCRSNSQAKTQYCLVVWPILITFEGAMEEKPIGLLPYGLMHLHMR